MKIQNWKMQPMRKSKPKSEVQTVDGIKVQTLIATKNNKRVILHRVEKTLPNGKKEIFIIKASPKEMEISH